MSSFTRALRMAFAMLSSILLLACAPAFGQEVPFRTMLDQARAAAEREQPAEALAGFDRALAAAQTPAQRVQAQSGRGNMLIWLGDYEAALIAYDDMLAAAPDASARGAALAGKVRSLVLLDRPREALESMSGSAPPDVTWSSELALAAASAALNAERSGHAQALLAEHRPLIAALPPDSREAHQAALLGMAVRIERADQVSAKLEYASESGDFTASRLTLGGAHYLPNDVQLSAQLMRSQYDQGSWHSQGAGVAAGLAYRFSDTLSGAARAGRLELGSWSPGVGSGNVVFAPGDRLRIEGFIDREVVETQAAFAAHIATTTYGASADYRVHPRLTLVGTVYRQDFSDGNQRDGIRVRAAFVINRPLGLGLELRARQFESTLSGPRGYFNPESLLETQLIGTWGTRLASEWLLHAAVGPGRQVTDPGGIGRTTAYAEVRAERLFLPNLRAQLAITRSTSAGTSDSGFGRTALVGSLLWLW